MEMKKEALDTLFGEFRKYNYIDNSLRARYGVKSGLRNADGTGVLIGVTNIATTKNARQRVN